MFSSAGELTEREPHIVGGIPEVGECMRKFHKIAAIPGNGD
jgi:hypothetical protein